MGSFRIARDGDVDLVFDGKLLGIGTSQRPDSRRWFEVRIYHTDNGAYVVSGTGRSQLPDEVDLNWAVVTKEPQEVIDALYRETDYGTRYLTRTARTALDMAAELDDNIAEVMVKRI